MKIIQNVIQNEDTIAFSTDGLDGNDVDKSAIYDFCIYFYNNNKVCSEALFVKSLTPPVTGEVIRDFLLQSLTDAKIVVDGRPKTVIWGVTDEGSNVQHALRLLKDAEIIEGHHSCFNHKLQNGIKDGMKATPGKPGCEIVIPRISCKLYSNLVLVNSEIRGTMLKNNCTKL
jgi:hypothetical protein